MQNTYTKEKETETPGKKVADYASSAILEGEARIKEMASSAQKKIRQGQEQLKDIVGDVDKQLHENPWPIVAGVSAASLLLGFIIGSSKRKS